MTVYKRKVSTKDARFKDRTVHMMTPTLHTTIPIPDTEVVCNGCNRNMYPNDGWLIYLTKRDLMKDRPYDIYCDECTTRHFPHAKEVSG